MSVNRRLEAPPAFTGKASNCAQATAFDGLGWAPTAPALIFFAIVAYFLSARQMFIALDDAAYLDYFSNNSYSKAAHATENWSWWRWIIEEPLWNVYSASLGQAFGPEAAFRVTIFLSTLSYLIFASTLSGGNWGTTLLFFVLHPNLGIQMYHNQVRQGVALSIFLMLVSVLRFGSWRRIGVAAGVAALVHSSFLLIFSLIASYATKPWLRISSALVAVSALVIVAHSVDIFSMIDLGRRQDTYSGQSTLNANYYIVSITKYLLIFYLLAPNRNKIDVSEWYFLTFLMAIVAIGTGAVHDAAGRMSYFAEASTCILVARNIREPNGLIALSIWVFAITLGIISDYQYDSSAQVRLFDKWQQILLGRD